VGKGKGRRRGTDSGYTSLARRVPTPPCMCSLNIFQVSRYRNRTVQRYFKTKTNVYC